MVGGDDDDEVTRSMMTAPIVTNDRCRHSHSSSSCSDNEMDHVKQKCKVDDAASRQDDDDQMKPNDPKHHDSTTMWSETMAKDGVEIPEVVTSDSDPNDTKCNLNRNENDSHCDDRNNSTSTGATNRPKTISTIQTAIAVPGYGRRRDNSHGNHWNRSNRSSSSSSVSSNQSLNESLNDDDEKQATFISEAFSINDMILVPARTIQDTTNNNDDTTFVEHRDDHSNDHCKNRRHCRIFLCFCIIVTGAVLIILWIITRHKNKDNNKNTPQNNPPKIPPSFLLFRSRVELDYSLNIYLLYAMQQQSNSNGSNSSKVEDLWQSTIATYGTIDLWDVSAITDFSYPIVHGSQCERHLFQ